MKQITREIIKNFHLKKYDFMGYHLNKNQATYHHIIKAENGGPTILSNGACLNSLDHNYLHIIEYQSIEAYIEINSMFKYFHSKGRIDIEDLIYINSILENFEKEHGNDRNSKGKLLIRREYYNRDFRNKGD